MLRFSLRTLMIVMLLAGPISALAWWFISKHGRLIPIPTTPLGWGLTLALVMIIFSAVAPLPGNRPALRLHCLLNLLLWAVLAVTYWPWMLVICGTIGWLFVWGDSQSPDQVAYQAAMYPTSVILAASAAGLPVLRTSMEWATPRYLQILLGLEAVLLLWTACVLVPKFWW